jgi:Glycosyl hydrolase family 115/Gylcosyl hydrolase family 115 C-terminal domain
MKEIFKPGSIMVKLNSKWICVSLFLLTRMFFLTDTNKVYAGNGGSYVSAKNGKGYFALSVTGKSAPLYISGSDYPGVIRALKDLQKDITTVTKAAPSLYTDKTPAGKEIILVGTIGKSLLIDGLIKQKKLNVTGIAGKWETFLLQVVRNPLPGVDRALVIAGSDKRATIYGIYDLSVQIGVSPWNWWADVPIKEQKTLYIIPGRYSDGEPAIKYRGIFINDEAPAFSGWTREKFGGVNHKVYEKMFELILRLKGNYLWPAMWGNAFNDDDKLDPVLADEYGIVMGTSHHEPMDRAQQEWKRYGTGAWNYETNSTVLKDFWKKGIENMGNKETIVTVGMRGDGDMPMTEGSNIALLEKIVSDQRSILAETTGKDVTQIPQMWALYKEVQDYYDKGMRVPDDVTLLLCDDNWGNIRKLPKLSDPYRKGGYGIYYHFDYVGGPRNYKWLNTNPLPKVWEQMHLAYEYGAKQVWVVNVGDLKPMEFPISFFLDYAWSPKKWPADRLEEYTRLWAQQQFGPTYAKEIAGILSKYTKYNGRRKPELLDQNTYSLVNYREFETMVADYNKLRDEAEALNKKIPAACKDAYYQLVLHPVQACSNLNELYFAAAKNSLYAKQGRAATNDMAEKVKDLYAKDAEISNYYNKILAGGKWDHMMDQTHIGYTYWQEPRVNKMPDVTQIDLPEAGAMGVAIEGSAQWWPKEQSDAVLPEFSAYPNSTHYVEVFNRGRSPFEYAVQTAPWVKVSPQSGKIDKEQRLWVSIDWSKAPVGIQHFPIIITSAGGDKVTIQAIVNNNRMPVKMAPGHAETNGYVSIEAEHYSKAVNTDKVQWGHLPDYGRTSSGMTPFPVTSKSQSPGGNSPHLEYVVNLIDTGAVKVEAYISPTIDFTNTQGLHYAVSFDDEQPQVININADKSEAAWNKDVSDNIKILISKHHISKPVKHILKFWMVDPGVVLQKIVLNLGGEKPSYLGPPESFYTTH